MGDVCDEVAPDGLQPAHLRDVSQHEQDTLGGPQRSARRGDRPKVLTEPKLVRHRLRQGLLGKLDEIGHPAQFDEHATFTGNLKVEYFSRGWVEKLHA